MTRNVERDAAKVPHPPSSGLDEFRKLCQLLTLVTALNDPDHHSTLNADHPHVVLRPLDSPEDRLSHAVTSILARDNETLACMFDEPVGINILVAQDDPMGLDAEGEFGGKYRVDTRRLSVTTAANPDQGSVVQSTHPIHLEVTGIEY